jgi:hypothetical protein
MEQVKVALLYVALWTILSAGASAVLYLVSILATL